MRGGAHRFVRQWFDGGDIFHISLAHNRFIKKSLHCQVVGLNCKKVVIGNIQDVLWWERDKAIITFTSKNTLQWCRGRDKRPIILWHSPDRNRLCGIWMNKANEVSPWCSFGQWSGWSKHRQTRQPQVRGWHCEETRRRGPASWPAGTASPTQWHTTSCKGTWYVQVEYWLKAQCSQWFFFL